LGTDTGSSGFQKNDPEYKQFSKGWRQVKRGHGLYRPPIEWEIPVSDWGLDSDDGNTYDAFGYDSRTVRGRKNGSPATEVVFAGSSTTKAFTQRLWIWKAYKFGQGERRGKPILARHDAVLDIPVESLDPNVILGQTPKHKRPVRSFLDLWREQYGTSLTARDFREHNRITARLDRDMRDRRRTERIIRLHREKLSVRQIADRVTEEAETSKLWALGWLYELNPCSKSEVQRTVQKWDKFMAISKEAEVQADMPTVNDRLSDLEQRVVETERQLGLPQGGQKAVEAAIDTFLQSTYQEAGRCG
jgi:hypothetical protein